MRYVTIKDIATALGLSKSTVSRALSGDSKNVSKETLEKIVETANKMGYRRNELAVNLRLKSTRIIGIMVPEMTTTFSMSFITTAQSLLNQQGYRVILALSDEDPETERVNLTMFDNARVEGILISACHNTANLDVYRSFLDRHIPIVLFDRTISDISVPAVKSNDYIQSFFMVEHLIRSGKKQIIHLTGPRHIQNTIDRKKGYRDALAKFHIPYDSRYAIESGVSVNDGANAIEKVLSLEIPFDAVFCFTETQALGAKQTLQEHNIAIPSKVAICCMSGTALSTLVHPPLTAVEQQVDEMATIAVRLILEKINDFSTPNQTITLESNIIIRKSTVE